MDEKISYLLAALFTVSTAGLGWIERANEVGKLIATIGAIIVSGIAIYKFINEKFFKGRGDKNNT